MRREVRNAWRLEVERCSSRRIRPRPTFDRYDRLLAYVRLPSGRQLNKTQVARGWAKVYVGGRQFQQHDSFKRAARRAKQLDRGAWGVCGGMHVREP